MRISDWSSDVCSSDLNAAVQRGRRRRLPGQSPGLRTGGPGHCPIANQGLARAFAAMACRDSCSAGSAGLLKSHPRHKKGLLRICFRTYSLFSHAVRALTTCGRIDRGSSKLRCRPRGNLFTRNCSWGGYILMISSHSFAKIMKCSALTVALGMCFVGAAIATETGGLTITLHRKIVVKGKSVAVRVLQGSRV